MTLRRTRLEMRLVRNQAIALPLGIHFPAVDTLAGECGCCGKRFSFRAHTVFLFVLCFTVIFTAFVPVEGH